MGLLGKIVGFKGAQLIEASLIQNLRLEIDPIDDAKSIGEVMETYGGWTPKPGF